MRLRKPFGLLLLGLWLATGQASAQSSAEEQALRQWKAGTEISQQAVEAFGEENCFVQIPIDDALFSRIEGKSYRTGCTLPHSELRYVKVLHRDLDGKILLGELVCNKAIAADLLAIFRTLYHARYPIERIVLIDQYGAEDGPSMRANNSSAFNFRFVAGTTVLSNHSRGMAVDLNPLYNPYVKTSNGHTVVDPREGAPYADRTREFPYKIRRGDRCYEEFTRRGFTWGGDWKSLKDYQHFEKKQ